MQFYGLVAVAEPAKRETLAAHEISTRIERLFASDDAGIGTAVNLRVATSPMLSQHHLIADVDLGGISLPVDLGTWAFAAANHDRAAECIVARAREILGRRDHIKMHLANLRARVLQVLSRPGGAVEFVDLRFWPVEGSARLSLRELRLELEVEQHGIDLTRVRESYHGYGIRDLTGCIRQDMKLQRRIAELREHLHAAEVPLILDHGSRVQLAEGKVPVSRLAKRIVADARERMA